MSGQTPGPWHLDTAQGCPWNITAADGTSVAIANQTVAVRLDPAQRERHANAALIAAAPDLIAALRYLVEMEDWRDLDDAEFQTQRTAGFDRARAAVARAEGREEADRE